MDVMRLRTMRRSTSSWLSPSPKREPTPPPMRLRGKMRPHAAQAWATGYWFWARRTCRRPSLRGGMQREDVQDERRAVDDLHVASGTAFFEVRLCCDGVSSSSNITMSAACAWAISAISSALPDPHECARVGRVEFLPWWWPPLRRRRCRSNARALQEMT